MEFKIKALSPNLVNDFLDFFDTEDHSDNVKEHKCYCVCWCSDDHRNGLEKMSSAQKRRELAKEYIKNGMIKGYLAYDKNRVVGWCNSNRKNDCQNCISWLRNMQEVKITEPSNTLIKSVFCFTIAKNYRKQGIATQLLKRVSNDSLIEGYTSIEAYPKKVLKKIDAFEGPLEMYLKEGFSIEEELKDYFVVRKNLKEE